jgi:membrane peptidoglycan carboxypeptidase
VQATRKLGRYFNVFVNYTAIDQSSNLQTAVPNTPLSYNTNILNGLNQVMSFGIGYSPREMRFRK